VAPVLPVTVNVAAETVPVTAGSVTPPVAVRVPAGARTTVPAAVLTATFPKFMLLAFTIAIGVTIVAVAVAVADTWPKVAATNANITIVTERIFFMIFKFLILV
jgi:hypothetical protein